MDIEILLSFADQHINEDVRRLALDAKKYPDIDMNEAIQQIAGRQSIEYKLPSWFSHRRLLYPIHLPLEQCSSESTALYKASLIEGDYLTDLTGGLGVDCSFMSAHFNHTTYVEKQEELCKLAQHNFNELGLSIKIVQQDCLTYLKQMKKCDCIYIDPARRDTKGQKTVALDKCEPNILSIKKELLSKGEKIIIKLSPMLDISLLLKELPETESVHIISVQNECKEILLILKENNTSSPLIHCINILKETTSSFSFTLEEEHRALPIFATQLKRYLYEPNASVMKGGAFRLLSTSFSLEKLQVNTHLYTSNYLIKHFPGRIFEIINSSPLHKKEAKNLLEKIQYTNVAVRNFPLTADELKKRLQLKDGGNWYLFGTTLSNNQKRIILTQKVS